MFIGPNDHELQHRRLTERVAALSAQIHALSTELIDSIAEVDRLDPSYGAAGVRSVTNWVAISGAWTTQEASRFARLATARERLGPVYDLARNGEIPATLLDAVSNVITDENSETICNIVTTCTPTQARRVISKYRELRPRDRRDASEHDAGDDCTPEPEPEYWWRQWTDDQGRGRIDAALSGLTAELLTEAYAAAARTHANEARKDDVSDRNDRADADRPSPARWYTPHHGAEADLAARRFAEHALADAHHVGTRRAHRESFKVIVTVDFATLLDTMGLGDRAGPFRFGSQCFTRSGRRLTNQELADVLSNSNLQPVVMADGIPIWMGTETRYATFEQHQLLNLRGHGHCEIPGCTNTAGLDAHHVRYAENSGPTSMDNLIHPCGPHHRQIHRERWRIVTEPGSQIFTIYTADGTCLGSTHHTGPPPDLQDISRAARATATRQADTAAEVRRLAPDAAIKDGAGAPLTDYALDVYLHALLAA